MGKTCCSSEVTPQCSVILGIAMLGRAEPIVEFKTSMTVVAEVSVFLACWDGQMNDSPSSATFLCEVSLRLTN